MMTQFSPSALLILSAVSLTPDISVLKRAIAETEDWDAACDKLKKTGVAGLFLDLVENYPELSEVDKSETTLPKEVLAKLRQIYLKYITRTVVLFDSYREVSTAFHKKNLKVVFFRGISLTNTLYNKQGLRPLNSIDILITADTYPIVMEQLESIGFRPARQPFLSGKDDNEPLKMIRNEESVVVHTRIHPPGMEYRLSAKDMYDRAVQDTNGNPPVYMLDLSDLLIDTCTLAHRNLFEPTFNISLYADLVRILKTHEDQINWEKMMGYCWVSDAEYVVMEQLIIAHQLFGAPLPPRIKQVYTSWVKEETIRQLMEHLNDKQPQANETNHTEKKGWSIKKLWGKLFIKIINKRI